MSDLQVKGMGRELLVQCKKEFFLLKYLSKQSEGLPCTGVVLSIVERLRPEQEDHFGMGLLKRPL